MARRNNNLGLSVFAEYDVSNWKALGENIQDLYNVVLYNFGKSAVEQAERILDRGPGPHPHRSDPAYPSQGIPPPHGFTWEDTGFLAGSVDHRIVRRGFMHAVEVFAKPVNVDGKLVDYGTFLELGWHPKVPTKEGGMRYTGNFYRYPWLSLAMAHAHIQAPKLIKEAWDGKVLRLFPNVRVTARSRSKSGTGVKVSGFKVSENITAQTRSFSTTRKILDGWLKQSFGKTPIHMTQGVPFEDAL